MIAFKQTTDPFEILDKLLKAVEKIVVSAPPGHVQECCERVCAMIKRMEEQLEDRANENEA